jgi:hypothetical protein
MNDTTTHEQDIEKELKELPKDIQDALNVIVGNRPESFKEEFSLPQPEFNGAAFGGKSAQQEFIKKKDPVEKKLKFTNNQVFVFDLTDRKNKEQYEKILDQVFDPENGLILAEPIKDPIILIDPNASTGYRAIVTIKTSKPEEYLVPKGTGFKVVPKAAKNK